MKALPIIITLMLGLVVGGFAGAFYARLNARVSVLCGPYSDNYQEARFELKTASEKLRAGDTNILVHLMAADDQIRKSQEWTERFLGKK